MMRASALGIFMCIGIGAATPVRAVEPGVLNFRPPLGPYRMLDPAEFDRSLRTDLQVDVCAVLALNVCLPITTLDATDSGDQRLRLDDVSWIWPSLTRYTTTAHIPSFYRGRLIRYTVRVNGLSTGSTTYRARSSRQAVSFMLYNDPEVRARQLTANGYGAFEIAVELVDEFGLGARRTTGLLYAEAFDALEIGGVLSDVFGRDAWEAAPLLAEVGFDALDVAGALDVAFAAPFEDAAEILLDLYDFDEALGGLMAVYDPDAAELAAAMFEADIMAEDTYSLLVDYFAVDFEGGGQALVTGGYTADDAVRVAYDDMVDHYIEIIEESGPVFRFHREERYLPSSIEWFLQWAHLEDEDGRTREVTVATLMEENSEMLLTGATETFLRARDDRKLPGELASAISYVHIMRQEAFTDLQFWLYYPYNGNGTVHVRFGAYSPPDGTPAPESGEHYGDWENVTLRLDNDTDEVLSARMSGHGEYHTYYRTGPSETRFTTRLEEHVDVYVSKNGHANFASLGDHPDYLIEVPVAMDSQRLGVCVPDDCTDFEFFEVCISDAPGINVDDNGCILDVGITIPGFDLGTIQVESQNLTDDGGPTLNAFDAYEVVAVYNSFEDSAGAEVGAGVYAEESHGVPLEQGHWMAYNGVFAPEIELHLLPSSVNAILFDQFGAVMQFACFGLDWVGGAMAALEDSGFEEYTCAGLSDYFRNQLYPECEFPSFSLFGWNVTGTAENLCRGAVDLVVDAANLCDGIQDLFMQACRAAFGIAGSWVPQSALDDLGEALGALDESRPDSPGSRTCGFLLQNYSRVDDKPQWIYEEEPNYGDWENESEECIQPENP